MKATKKGCKKQGSLDTTCQPKEWQLESLDKRKREISICLMLLSYGRNLNVSTNRLTKEVQFDSFPLSLKTIKAQFQQRQTLA